jgi:gamma-glutamylcyclotransferase (GGCT)/AIG2-like uncharacterized protein YtfP
MAMTPNIFVYGTLVSSAEHPKGSRLRREARLIGEATLQGQLYSLGRYPGLIETNDPTHLVHGEVYALNGPAGSLVWLDAYEGISPDSEGNDYERCERKARLTSGQELTVWVYLYRASVRGLPVVPDGRWTSRKG